MYMVLHNVCQKKDKYVTVIYFSNKTSNSALGLLLPQGPEGLSGHPRLANVGAFDVLIWALLDMFRLAIPLQEMHHYNWGSRIEKCTILGNKRIIVNSIDKCTLNWAPQ